MASITMGTLYAYATGQAHGQYTCKITYDSTTRSGTKVTVNNLKVTMSRVGSGYTTNRIAGSATVGGVTVVTNKTLNSAGTASPATITFDLGSPSFTTTATSFAVSIQLASTGYSTSWGNFQGNSPLAYSGTWSCPGAYPTAAQSVKSKTETSIVMNWSSDSTCDYLWYSTNNGSSWTGVNVTDGTSGTYTISGLSANTTYNVKTRLRRKDSQLTADSSASSIATYAYPYANSMPNFTIGNSVTIGVYNPLGRTFSITMIAANGSELTASSTYSGTSVSGFNAQSYINFWNASIPNAQSGTYKVKITYGSQSTTKTGGTYSVNANTNAPTIGSLTYADVNSTVTAITGNDQNIVQNQSTVRYTVSGLAAKNGATISSAKVTVNGNSYNLTLNSGKTSATGGNAAIDSSSNVTATVTVTDSRGLTSTANVTVNMLSWSLPTAQVELYRQSNYYATTYLTVDAKYSSLNGKNTIAIQYCYQQVGQSGWSDWVSIQDNVQSTLTLGEKSEWTVQVKLTDLFGTTIYNIPLAKGIPIQYWDVIKNSVGINCFPTDNESFEVNGFNIERSIMTRGLSTQKTNLAVSTYTIIPLDLSNSTGTKLTATSNGGIKVGAGVSKVLVSGKMAIEGVTAAGNRHLRICKNSYSANNTMGWAWDTLAVSDAEDIIIPPQLVNVSEGDVIYLYYWTQQSSDKIGGNEYGGRTSLTVEAVA